MLRVGLLNNLWPGRARLLAVAGILDPRDRRSRRSGYGL